MSKRELLTPAHREAFTAFPELDDRSLVKHYTLTASALELIDQRRGAVNQLWSQDQPVDLPEPVIDFVAEQLGCPPAQFKRWLSKFGAYPRQNGLAVASRELGRLERSLFTLEWLQSPELRRRVLKGLNEGEARHALADAVFLHRRGELRDRTAEAQEHRASGLSLLTAYIAMWKNVQLERAVKVLRERGEVVPDALPEHVSPLAWEHINLTGDHARRSRVEGT